jgi:hypothetical protein
MEVVSKKFLEAVSKKFLEAVSKKFCLAPLQKIFLKLCHHILKVILGEGHFVLESSGFEHGIDQIVDFLFGEFVGLGSVYEGVEEFGLVHLAVPSIQSLSSVFPQKNIVFKNSWKEIPLSPSLSTILNIL